MWGFVPPKNDDVIYEQPLTGNAQIECALTSLGLP